MSTITRQISDVHVDIIQQSIVYISNTMFQMLIRIPAMRGLKPNYIIQNREFIENGLFVWLAEQTLLNAYLEVFFPGSRNALERWDFHFIYSDTPATSPRRPPLEDLNTLCAQLDILPEQVEYRMVVQTAPKASKVPGWEPTVLRSLDGTESQVFEAWGHGGISVNIAYTNGSV